MLTYKGAFQPSVWMDKPWAILAVAAVIGETEEEAERLASSQDLNRLRRDRGEFGPLPSTEEAAAYPYSEAERQSIRRNRERLFVGTPDAVASRLAEFARSTRADEVMVTSAIHDQEARKRSYARLIEALNRTAALAA